jgi:hypothetical protein
LFSKIKSILGLTPSFEKWDDMKSKGLSDLLGPEHEMVMHSIIPFMVGGGLDLYYYPQACGFAIATKELIDEFGVGPKNAEFDSFEISMFSPIEFDFSMINEEGTPIGSANRRIEAALNALARYAFETTINVNDTIEFPIDFDQELGGQCFIVSAISKHGKSLCIGKKEFGLMVAINIHRSEMVYAQNNGGAKLVSILENSGHFPYSTLDRLPVV